MSKGKWLPESCPDGHREDAELAARLEDIAARLSATTRDVGILSLLVRQMELRAKRESAPPVQEHGADLRVAS